DGEPRLAGPAGAGQREQPHLRTPEQVCHVLDLALATDERRRLRRQARPRRREVPLRREVLWGFKTCVPPANPDFSRRELSLTSHSGTVLSASPAVASVDVTRRVPHVSALGTWSFGGFCFRAAAGRIASWHGILRRGYRGRGRGDDGWNDLRGAAAIGSRHHRRRGCCGGSCVVGSGRGG